MELSAAITHCVARARARLLRQEHLAALADVQDDGPGFEQREPVLLEDRHLPEGLQRAVLRLVLVALREQAGPVRKARLLQRPAHAKIPDEASREIGNPLEGGYRDHAVHSIAIVPVQVCCSPKASLQPSARLSRRSAPREGVSWNVWTVQPSGSAKVMVTGISTSAGGDGRGDSVAVASPCQPGKGGVASRGPEGGEHDASKFGVSI